MSSSSLLSSASSSALLDSSLENSAWNRHKAAIPIQGKPGICPQWDATSTGDSPHQHLLQKRIYPTLLQHSKDDAKELNIDKESKTELEAAVLRDCLSTNFLFAHLPPDALQFLVEAFVKVPFRKNEIIVRQGDDADALYLLFSGEVQIQKDGVVVTGNDKYTVFGEMALLTASPQDATVKATSSPCTCYKLHRAHFQQVLHATSSPHTDESVEEQFQMLKEAIPTELVEYLQDDETALRKLVSGMSTHSFETNDILGVKGTPLHAFCIITQGQALLTDVSLGGRAYENMPLGQGQSQTSFGWLTMAEDEPLEGNITATTDGTCLLIPKQVFLNALGGGKCGKTTLEHIVAKHAARIELQQLTVFSDSTLDDVQLNGLLDLMHHCEYASQEVVIRKGEKVDAALYFVRQGSVTLQMPKDTTPSTQTIEAGGYFGEKNMLLDQNKDGKKHYSMRSPITVIANENGSKMDVLYLEECRKVVDTTLLGLGQPINKQSMTDESLRLANLTRHTLLGSGSFGQVWLASSNNDNSSENEEQQQIVALKIQPKHALVQSKDQAQRVVAERNIMASLHSSPFVIRLYNAFQDKYRLYMVTSLLQGGELESLIPHDGLSEEVAKFYAAGILEGLTYMHRRHILHRDVKTANVLLNSKGYPVLIDLGFAKYVADKTFTFCGSAMYTAPEIIRYKGHDKGCDHWSWAVLVYRMVTGKYPFYKKGMDELTLYKQICKGTLELDGLVSMDFRMLMVSVLYPDPHQRLGSRINGWRDIFASAWLATVDLPTLRKQALPAPWVPDLKDPLDASRFHTDSADDLMMDNLRSISDTQQHIFSNFGPHINAD